MPIKGPADDASRDDSQDGAPRNIPGDSRRGEARRSVAGPEASLDGPPAEPGEPGMRTAPGWLPAHLLAVLNHDAPADSDDTVAEAFCQGGPLDELPPGPTLTAFLIKASAPQHPADASARPARPGFRALFLLPELRIRAPSPLRGLRIRTQFLRTAPKSRALDVAPVPVPDRARRKIRAQFPLPAPRARTFPRSPDRALDRTRGWRVSATTHCSGLSGAGGGSHPWPRPPNLPRWPSSLAAVKPRPRAPGNGTVRQSTRPTMRLPLP